MKVSYALAVTVLSLTAVITPAFGAAGVLDPSFGSGGVVHPNVGAGASFSFADAAIAPNGDTVVGGSVSNLSEGTGVEAAVVRYLPDGTQDPSFGVNGVVLLPPPSSFFLGASLTMAVAVQPDGKILTVFFAFNNTSTAVENLLIRLGTNGAVDPTFGNKGSVALDFPVPAGFGASATIVLAQPDGRILLTGNITPPFRSKSSPLTLLARYLASGAPDTSFGNNGLVEAVTPIDLPSTIALLTDDSLLALNAAGQVAQFSSSGAPQAQTTGGSIVTAKSAADLSGFAFVAQDRFLAAAELCGPDGKTNVDAALQRFELTGVLDSAFESPTIRLGPDAPFVKNEGLSLGVDSQGRGILGVEYLTATTEAAGVARVNANGSLDPTFGDKGVSLTTPGFALFGILVEPNNDVLLIGGDGSLARYSGQ